MQEEAPVGLLEHALGTGAAQRMAAQAPWPMGVVQLGEEQCLAVVGPGHAAVAVFKGQGGDRAAGEVFHVQAVDLVATGIQAVGQQPVVGADTERAQRQEAAVGQCVGVEQQLFLAFIDGVAVVGRAWAAVVARIFVASSGAGVVQVRPPG